MTLHELAPRGKTWHRAISVSIKGESYRLKEKLKAVQLAKHIE